MNVKSLEESIVTILSKRIELSKLDYNNPAYDDLEEELHDLEDVFQDDFGDELEEVLQDIHDEWCPESEVLLPIAYLGNGVLVDSEKFPSSEVRLQLVAAPPQLVFKIGKDKQHVVWTAKD